MKNTYAYEGRVFTLETVQLVDRSFSCCLFASVKCDRSQRKQGPLSGPHSQVVYLESYFSHEVPWIPGGCQSIKAKERELVTLSYFQGIITCPINPPKTCC